MHQQEIVAGAAEVVHDQFGSVARGQGRRKHARTISGDRAREVGPSSITTVPVETLLTHHGYLAIALLALIEACCVPIPSEITFAFGGVLAHEGHLNLAAVIVIGTLAEVVGSYISYAVGRFGGRPLVERVGRFVLITKSDLDRAERWFDGRGEFALAIGRMLPILRAFVSVIAGISQMKAVRFGIFSLIGTALYATALASLGYAVASQWHHVVHEFSIAGYVILALIIVVIAAGLLHRIRTIRSEAKA